MQLEYEIIYSNRKTIAIMVERDRSVVVRAPNGTSDETIHAAVESKKLWLYEKTNHDQKYPARQVRKEFITGETIMYLGRYYRLEITDDDEPGVRFQNRFYISRQHQARADQLLREWYIARAERRLTPRIQHFAEAMGVSYNRILISDLKYRWASCSIFSIFRGQSPPESSKKSLRFLCVPTFLRRYFLHTKKQSQL